MPKKNPNAARFEAILEEAHKAAEAAVAALGPENPRALDCGFAWATIDGRDHLANYCRKQVKDAKALRERGGCGPGFVNERERYYGGKAYPTGWQWWKPGNFPGQAIGHHEAGARAFRDVLAKHGITVNVGSRYD